MSAGIGGVSALIVFSSAVGGTNKKAYHLPLGSLILVYVPPTLPLLCRFRDARYCSRQNDCFNYSEVAPSSVFCFTITTLYTLRVSEVGGLKSLQQTLGPSLGLA